MKVQLPNEQDFIEMNIDMSKFKLDKTIDNIQYGFYNGSYIAIKNILCEN